MLTAEEILFVLELLQEKYGFGYSEDPKVGRLQAKLSIMLEATSQQVVETEGYREPELISSNLDLSR